METFGDEIHVQQGECWNYDKLLSASNREYIPFIISNQRRNPYFVITVASTKYEKNLRYVKSWWNSVENFNIPTFYQTVPLNIGEVSQFEIVIVNNTVTIKVYDEESELWTEYEETYNTRLLYQYTIPTDEIDTDLGHKPYHYRYFKYDTSGVPIELSDEDEYQCKITFNFLSEETSKWGSQNYMYQVTLVSGQLMADRFEEIYLAHDEPEDWPDTIEAQYNYIKIQWPDELQPDIDVDSPLGFIEVPEPILSPTRLYVYNNLRTLI